MIDLILFYWKSVTILLYSLTGVGLCYILRNKLQGVVMECDQSLIGQNTVLCVEEGHQQVEQEREVHLSVMLGLVVSTLTILLRLFFSDVLLEPAIGWGYFAAISYFYLLIHFLGERLLLSLFRSKPVSLVVWVGGRLETQIYKEGVGCVAIAFLLVLIVVLVTIKVIPLACRFFLFYMVPVYMCFRRIGLMRGGSVYTQEVESLRNLKLKVEKLDADDRVFVSVFFLLFLSGVMAVCLVGVVVPDLQEKNPFVKGCSTLKMLAVKGWGRLKALTTTT